MVNLEQYIANQPLKAVDSIDVGKKKIKYNTLIKSHRNIKEITGDEELVRAIVLTKLVNEYGYPIDRIELEKTYEIGRPKVITPRIDIIVKDIDGNAFLYIELKSPDEFEKDQDEIIEKQLFNLAGAELGLGKRVKYLVLMTCDLNDESFGNKLIVIDYDKYHSFDEWKNERYSADEIPIKYDRAIKTPYIKDGKKDLEKDYTKEQIDSIRKNLHNVLWGGGGTDDNEVFSSLVNIILAKIQDESEKRTGEKYDFQSFAFSTDEGDAFETNEDLFNRINNLYRRALKERMYITEQNKIDKSFVINEEKFSLTKLKYAIMVLEKYSLVDGKNSYDGKDILGDFFEGIIRDGFKQSKGQFFTHTNIVTFILWALQLDKLAIQRINTDKEIPYLIDPSAGSGTFLIEYMRFITQNVKYRFKEKLAKNRDVKDKFDEWFMPDHRENKWAKDYIYGIEHNFNLGTASKVNMILHGDGSTNIFVKDGLLPFSNYDKKTAPNALKNSSKDKLYAEKEINGQFDVVISNPPFSVELDTDTKKSLSNSFIFGDKKNSENLFIERYYHLLRENGRMGIVLPESVYDTTENKYIRLFIYKYFTVKAVVSLPQVTFSPYTNTKTSIIFAQKKTAKQIEKWNTQWEHYSKKWGRLKTRCENIVDVYLNGKDRNKLRSIKDLNPVREKWLLQCLLKSHFSDKDKSLDIADLVVKYADDIADICKPDKDLKDVFGFVNTWWVFSGVSRKLNYEVFIAEVDNVGYKRTKRGEKSQPNDLFRVNEKGLVLVDDEIMETALDYMRTIKWD